jgi:hypothetical protein
MNIPSMCTSISSISVWSVISTTIIFAQLFTVRTLHNMSNLFVLVQYFHHLPYVSVTFFLCFELIKKVHGKKVLLFFSFLSTLLCKGHINDKSET